MSNEIKTMKSREVARAVRLAALVKGLLVGGGVSLERVQTLQQNNLNRIFIEIELKLFFNFN